MSLNQNDSATFAMRNLLSDTFRANVEIRVSFLLKDKLHFVLNDATSGFKRSNVLPPSSIKC